MKAAVLVFKRQARGCRVCKACETHPTSAGAVEVCPSLRRVALLARLTMEKAVTAVMVSLRHIFVKTERKSRYRCGPSKKGCKKTRARFIMWLSRAGISRRRDSKIFCHMMSGLNLASAGKDCHSEFRAMATLLLPLLDAKPCDGPLLFWSGQIAKKQTETHRGTSLEKTEFGSMLDVFTIL